MPFAEREDEMMEGKTMTDEQTTPAQTLEQARIVNRHMARTLTQFVQGLRVEAIDTAGKFNRRPTRPITGGKNRQKETYE